MLRSVATKQKQQTTKMRKGETHKPKQKFWFLFELLCHQRGSSAALEALQGDPAFLLKHAANAYCNSTTLFSILLPPTFQRLTNLFNTTAKLTRKSFLHSNSATELE